MDECPPFLERLAIEGAGKKGALDLYCGADLPSLARRDVIRIFQRSMSVASVDRAIRRLVTDRLLVPSNPNADGGSGHVFRVDSVVFDPASQLLDLVTDPRRPRQ